MIRREHYISPVREFYESDLIKIITGIRRCGKSIILEQIMSEIKEKADNIIYLNFEDRRTASIIKDGDGLISYVETHRKAGKCYIFLDEVQVLDGWQDACKTLRLYDNSVFITGSNSKLLSSEFTKELSGRYVSFRVRPFVYKEILEYAKELNKEVSVTDYLVWGGFPKRFEFSSLEAQRIYLNDLDDTIVINDLIRRYKIRKESLFKSLVNYVLRSNSRIFSAKSICDYIKREHESCSINTIMKYIDHLEEAYIIESVKQYSTKTKRELSYYAKLYNADVAFNSIRCIDNRFDLTHNLENIVYNELRSRGYSVDVGVVEKRGVNSEGKTERTYLEIDFIANLGSKRYYIQSAFSMPTEEKRLQEKASLVNVNDSFKKIILVKDVMNVTRDEDGITTMSIYDFLLKENSLEL